MEKNNNKNNSLISCIGSPDTEFLTKSIQTKLIQALNQSICYEIVPYNKFADGETKIEIKNSVRGKHVYVICDSHSISEFNNQQYTSLNDKIMHAFLILQTAKKHGAKSINIILTCYPYSRQDKPIHGGLKKRVNREPSSTKFIADVIEMLKVKYCITLDIHNNATSMAFQQTQFVSLYSGWFIKEVIQQLIQQKNLNQNEKYGIVLSPTDEGGDKKLNSIFKDLVLEDNDNTEISKITVIKERNYTISNKTEKINIYGDIKNKNVLIYDDILDSGGTLAKLIEEMHKLGPKSINIAITHGMFNGRAIDIFQDLKNKGLIENIYTTNTINRGQLPNFVKYINASNIFANAIISIVQGDSINYNNNEE